MGGKSSLPEAWLTREKQQLHDRWVARAEIHSRRVLEAFLEVPRELFVPVAMQTESYVDYPLPIGAGQTISQPTTVMLMLDLLDPQSGDRVLEIGAGSGYNAALLARLAKEVVTVERHEVLAKQAETLLQRAGFRNIRMLCGDGKLGAPDHAPFDRIIITAAAHVVPQPLLDQLAPGGTLVAPVGETHGCWMTRICKNPQGTLERSRHGRFSFVPLV